MGEEKRQGMVYLTEGEVEKARRLFAEHDPENIGKIDVWVNCETHPFGPAFRQKAVIQTGIWAVFLHRN